MAKSARWALVLWAVTLGLGGVGWFLTVAVMEGPENPLALLALPALGGVLVLAELGVHPVVSFLSGGLAQFAACLLVVSISRAAYRLALWVWAPEEDGRPESSEM